MTRDELEAAIESEDGHVHGPGCGHDHGEAKPKKAAKPAAKKPAAKKEAAPAQTAAEKPAKKTSTKKAPAKKV